MYYFKPWLTLSTITHCRSSPANKAFHSKSLWASFIILLRGRHCLSGSCYTSALNLTQFWTQTGPSSRLPFLILLGLEINSWRFRVGTVLEPMCFFCSALLPLQMNGALVSLALSQNPSLVRDWGYHSNDPVELWEIWSACPVWLVARGIKPSF